MPLKQTNASNKKDTKQTIGLKAWKQGHVAEKIAYLFMCLKCSKVLQTRYKTPVGEIDLISRRGKTIIFLEVKFRKTQTSALESIHYHQKKRIVRTAHYFLSHHPRYNNHNLRFDVLTFNRYFLPKYLKNAWDENLQ